MSANRIALVFSKYGAFRGTLSRILPCLIDRSHLDVAFVLPIAIVGILFEEPSLQPSLLHVALYDENMLHETMLDNESVNLAVPARHRRLDILCFLVEVIVLVLSELFPPLFAAR